MADYWQTRSELNYYKVAEKYVRDYCLVGSLLDVGGGVLLGARYLERFPEFSRTSVELPQKSKYSLKDVQVIQADFLEWMPPQVYDVVLCLQMLEHTDNPILICQKLFICASVVVISVPYCWPAGACKYHKQDPVTREKLLHWVGSPPLKSQVTDKRLVAIWQHQHK